MLPTKFLSIVVAGLFWLSSCLDVAAQQDTYDYFKSYFDAYGTSDELEGIYGYNATLTVESNHPWFDDDERYLQAAGYICIKLSSDDLNYDITIAVNDGTTIRGNLKRTASPNLYQANCKYSSGVPVAFYLAQENGVIKYSYQKPKAEVVNFVDNLDGVDYEVRRVMKSSLTYSREVFGIKLYPTEMPSPSSADSGRQQWSGNGSGIILSEFGHIVTNFHVVDDADQIEIEVIHDGKIMVYDAAVLQVDRVNDLAIIKVVDINFDSFDTPPFSVKFTPSEVGTKVYAYGYPMALTAMGKEVKVTDGIISAKTGFNGDITTYQISAPIQGGNSGGPLFDEHANLIGINSSGLNKEIADNVGYSIKTSYVRNVFDVLPKSVELPKNQSLQSKTLVEQIAAISPFVVLIKVK